MLRKLLLLATIPALPLLIPAVHADETLVGAGPGLFSGGDCPCVWVLAGLPFGDEAASEFTLSAPSFVNTISVTLGASKGDQLSLSLVSALTGVATTFATDTLTAAGGRFPPFDLETMTVDESLAPGTYFLRLSAVTLTPGSGDGWEESDNTLIQNAGTVSDGMWTSFDSGATWTFDDISNPICPLGCRPAVFAVNGVASIAAPEPSSALLLAAALLGFGIFQYRRRMARVTDLSGAAG